MPISSAIVGRSGPSMSNVIDSRWLMAYAAGIGETKECYLDTRCDGGIVAHPMFPVCYEWPAVVGTFRAVSDSGITPDEAARGVHATHDLTIHRMIRAGDRLTTTATISSLEQRKPGAYMVSRLDTLDASGASVSTTWYGTL